MKKKRWLDILAWVVVCLFVGGACVTTFLAFGFEGTLKLLAYFGAIMGALGFVGLFGWAANRISSHFSF